MGKYYRAIILGIILVATAYSIATLIILFREVPLSEISTFTLEWRYFLVGPDLTLISSFLGITTLPLAVIEVVRHPRKSRRWLNIILNPALFASLALYGYIFATVSFEEKSFVIPGYVIVVCLGLSILAILQTLRLFFTLVDDMMEEPVDDVIIKQKMDMFNQMCAINGIDFGHEVKFNSEMRSFLPDIAKRIQLRQYEGAMHIVKEVIRR